MLTFEYSEIRENVNSVIQAPRLQPQQIGERIWESKYQLLLHILEESLLGGETPIYDSDICAYRKWSGVEPNSLHFQKWRGHGGRGRRIRNSLTDVSTGLSEIEQ